MIQDGINGRLIEPANVAPIATAIKDLAESAEVRERFSQNAVTTIARHWSFRRRMTQIAEIYTDVLDIRDERSRLPTEPHDLKAEGSTACEESPHFFG